MNDAFPPGSVKLSPFRHTPLPRIGRHYGTKIPPVLMGTTWIEGEEWNTDYGQFQRRGLVRHSVTKELVKVRLDVPDTYFSIPATTDTEHGYVTSTETEFEFRPHTDQKGMTPVEFRKSVKNYYK